jgi:hypothetical protein
MDPGQGIIGMFPGMYKVTHAPYQVAGNHRIVGATWQGDLCQTAVCNVLAQKSKSCLWMRCALPGSRNTGLRSQRDVRGTPINPPYIR